MVVLVGAGGADEDVLAPFATPDVVAAPSPPNSEGVDVAGAVLGAVEADPIVEVAGFPRPEKRLGAADAAAAVVEVPGPEVLDAGLPKRLGIAAGAVVVVGALEPAAPENKPPNAGAVALDPAAPNGLGAAAAVEAGCELEDVPEGKLKVGFGAVAVVLDTGPASELAGLLRPENKLAAPPELPPNNPPGWVLGGLLAASCGLTPPNRPPDDGCADANRLGPGALGSAGGGPAGVVEFPKLNALGFVAAGVVDPAGAALDAGANRDWPAGALLPPKRPDGAEEFSLFGVPKLLVVGVEVPCPSSFFCPKLKPPLVPPNTPELCAVVPLPLKSPPAGVALLAFLAPPKRLLPPPALPVLAPNNEGVEGPEPEFDPVFPKSDGFEAPAPAAAPKFPNGLAAGLAVVVNPNRLPG